MNRKGKKSAKHRLRENTVESDVFGGMTSEPVSDERFAKSIRLQFPKFSKNFEIRIFDEFIVDHIGKENIKSLGRLSFPNEFQMELKSDDVREKLIRMGRTYIGGRTCWIFPLSQAEIRGYVHWLPNAIDNETVKQILEPFGEVLFVDRVSYPYFDLKFESDSRYFAVKLAPGKAKEELPYFVAVDDFSGMISIRGRAPACFHCRETGHKKSECRKYRERLYSYSKRPKGSGRPRTRPRGEKFVPGAVPTDARTRRKKSSKKRSGETKSGKDGESAPIEPLKLEDLGKRLDEEMEKVKQRLMESLLKGVNPEEGEKKKKKRKKKKKNITEEALAEEVANLSVSEEITNVDKKKNVTEEALAEEVANLSISEEITNVVSDIVSAACDTNTSEEVP